MTKPATIAPIDGQRRTGWINSDERKLIALVLALGLACLLASTWPGRVVDWPAFAPSLSAAAAMVAIGFYARVVKDARRLGLVAIGFGLFMLFSALSAIFIFAQLPLANPLIDQRLAAIDATLGYDWRGFVETLATWPLLSNVLRWVYVSALVQLTLLVVALGLLAREVQLYRLLMTGIVGLILTTFIWMLMPSIGPSAYNQLSPEVLAATGLTTTPEMGRHLLGLVERGPAVITPGIITGVIAFPSFHINMALLVAWYSRRTLLFVPGLLALIGMVPATLMHGGHHLVDLFGGALVFAACVMLSARVIPQRPS